MDGRLLPVLLSFIMPKYILMMIEVFIQILTLDSLSGLGQVNNCLEPPLQTFHMCHQGKGGPYRYCEPVKCSWKYCVFYVFFVDVLHFLCFVFVMVKKHTANNLYTKVRHLFLGPSKYFSPKYEVVTASCVFFCVIGSFRVPSC